MSEITSTIEAIKGWADENDDNEQKLIKAQAEFAAMCDKLDHDYIVFTCFSRLDNRLFSRMKVKARRELIINAVNELTHLLSIHPESAEGDEDAT